MYIFCHFTNGRVTNTTHFEAHRFNLHFPQHLKGTDLLEEDRIVDKDSALAAFRDIYERHGWSKKNVRTQPPSPPPPNSTSRCPIPEPLFVAPHMAYSNEYHMLGITTPSMEEKLLLLAPGFNLGETIQQFCDSYETDVEACFPSLTNESSNVRPEDRIVTKRCTPTPDEDKPRLPRKERLGRIVPIYLLPHLLTLFPESCLRATGILLQCEMLEVRIRNSSETVGYPNYLMEQVNMLQTNRHHLAFLFQRGMALPETERDLFNEIIVTLVENQRIEAAVAKKDRHRQLDIYKNERVEKRKRL